MLLYVWFSELTGEIVKKPPFTNTFYFEKFATILTTQKLTKK
jgi:hypothetical protein